MHDLCIISFDRAECAHLQRESHIVSILIVISSPYNLSSFLLYINRDGEEGLEFWNNIFWTRMKYDIRVEPTVFAK
jgi:hypothetical protein